LSAVHALLNQAFERLRARPGFLDRPDQTQLAMLLADLIEGSNSGAFEAPTGLGKSLATLIPAIAHALVNGRRTVIATYTNVLAEQYWRKDLPLALSLFDAAPRCRFLIGRQRYACLMQMDEHAPELTDPFVASAELGIETEFRGTFKLSQRELSKLWQQISAPPVCPARACPAYNACFYYNARRGAETADIVITNHSVVLQDAIAKGAEGWSPDSDSQGPSGLLGRYDFLILDEAHDFPTAAFNGLEFELSAPKLNAMQAVATRLERTILPTAQRLGEGSAWSERCADFREEVEDCKKALLAYSLGLGRPGILAAAPDEVWSHPQVQNHRTTGDTQEPRELAFKVSELCDGFVSSVEDRLARWKEDEAESLKGVAESVRNYCLYIREYSFGCARLFDPGGVAVSYAGRAMGQEALLRQDVIDLAPPLDDLLWSKTPYACLSATLSTDGNFDYFRRVTGAKPDFEEVLPSPFDFGTNAALFMPAAERIQDPTVARREGTEEVYWRQVARELSEIIRMLQGRTLALFHSRREMEGVLSFMDLPPELPVYMQLRSGAGTVGQKFLDNVHASLFALRSFWTGFDAPGETCSCVALVRVPFEVPVDPPQIARMAYLQTQGMDAFRESTLPQAKMMMRQGAGRLIRRADDKGIIALLDPRLRTKRYGEEILANLPEEMRRFDDIADAIGWIGLEL
jgi:ATP-dependent DNA helicase DinG